MTRRACSLLLVLVLAAEMAAGLYACSAPALSVHPEHDVSKAASVSHDHQERRGHGAGNHLGLPSGDASLASSHKSDGHIRHSSPYASPAARGSLPEHCNRHHPGPCPHAGAAIHPCSADPAAGLELIAAGVPSATVRPVLWSTAELSSSYAAVVAPTGAASPPELPPPRAL
jgi:hypothetical protein